MKYIYKLTYEKLELGVGESDFEKVFFKFYEDEKILKRKRNLDF
jgi:hypothetical protein